MEDKCDFSKVCLYGPIHGADSVCSVMVVFLPPEKEERGWGRPSQREIYSPFLLR